jgi:hypothetical protein
MQLCRQPLEPSLRPGDKHERCTGRPRVHHGCQGSTSRHEHGSRRGPDRRGVLMARRYGWVSKRPGRRRSTPITPSDLCEGRRLGALYVGRPRRVRVDAIVLVIYDLDTISHSYRIVFARCGCQRSRGPSCGSRSSERRAGSAVNSSTRHSLPVIRSSRQPRNPQNLHRDVPSVAVHLARPDRGSLRSAVAGSDAVMSCLGPRGRHEYGVVSAGTEAILAATEVMALVDLGQSCSPKFPTWWRWSG